MQRRRRAFQLAFFALFLAAPALNLLRFDLNETQLWFLGMRWSLGIDDFRAGAISANEMALRIILRVFVPALLLVAAFLGVAWRYGRIYCGWLCPHFSLVELLNGLLQRACGRLSVWERAATPRLDGRRPDPRWWPVFVLSCVVSGFAWAVTLLTYLLPPAEVWGNLLQGTPTANQARFLGIATLAFSVELMLARHFFCRFGCAVGLFQSLVWVANPRGRVVAFPRGGGLRVRGLRHRLTMSLERAHPSHCRICDPPHGNACDRACPMRLDPRNLKRRKFSCVQCGLCVEACEDSQSAQRREPLLHWAVGVDALRETMPEGGKSRVLAQALPAETP
jgi:ferredoxin-type protein NapH